MTRRTSIALLAAVAVAAAGVGGYWWMAQRRAAWRATAPLPAPPSLVGTIYPVAKNLYVVPGGGGNTAVFVTAQGVVLVDTKYANREPDLIDQVRTVTDKPITHVINTHSHDDHSGGGRLLPDAEIVVQERTAANLAQMRKNQRQPEPARPPRTYRDRSTLFEGDDAIDLYYFGPAHTGGDTFVVFRSAGVMHAGDVFIDKTAPVINLPWGGDAVEYVATMRKAVEGIKGVTRVITGHGDVLSWADFVTYSEFMRLIVDQARTARSAGTDANQARKALVLPEKFSDYKLDRLAFTYQDIYKSLTPWWHFW